MLVNGVRACYGQDMQKTQEIGETASVEFLRSDEVMDLLRISRRTLDRWATSGRLPSSQPGGERATRLYPRKEIEAMATPSREVTS